MTISALARSAARYATSLAGIRNWTVARSTGTLVVLAEAPAQGLPVSDGGRWALICEGPAANRVLVDVGDPAGDSELVHAGIAQFTRRVDAEAFLAHPEEWCPVCQEARA